MHIVVQDHSTAEEPRRTKRAVCFDSEWTEPIAYFASVFPYFAASRKEADSTAVPASRAVASKKETAMLVRRA